MRRENPILALLSVTLLSAIGMVVAFSIPIAVFPEMTFRRAIILVENGSLPVDQMMATVTRPLEEAAYGALGVELVRSTTTRGSSEIDVTFSNSADPVTSYQLLNAALAEVPSKLPPGTSIDSRLLTTGTFPILEVSLSSKVRSLAELTDIAIYDLVPGFHRIPDVYRVEVSGGKYREYVVRLDPPRMLAHNLSPQEVVAGLAKANVVASAGRIFDSHRMLLTVVTTDLHRAEQLAALPIASIGGQPVYVRDVGSVELGVREDYIRTASENGPAVLIGISRRPGGNTVLIADRTRGQLDAFRRLYPDVQFSVSYDQSALVTESFASVRDAVALGLALAVAVVLAFTLSPLSALVAAIVVPSTIAITFLAMKAAGMSFNMMTLGALAAGIGLFIDDAIVMIEAIHRGRSAGRSTAQAVTIALSTLRRPLVASTLTAIVVFAPLVLLTGVTGVFFRALGETLGAGLAISLLLALYFTPALERGLERWRRGSRKEGRMFDLLRRAYLVSLRPFMRLPVLALVLVAFSLGSVVWFYESIGTDYLPWMDEGAFILDYLTPSKGTLSDTDALLNKIQAVLKQTPEVAAFSRRTGTQLGFFLTESNRGDISVRLRSHRSRNIDQVMESVRGRILHTVSAVQIEFSQMLQDLIGDLSGIPQPIEIKVFGPDQSTIEDTAVKVAASIRTIPGVVDVFDGIVMSQPEERVRVNEAAVARYGMTPDYVRAALRSVVEGTVATRVRVGDRLFAVRVRYPDSFHRDLSNLAEVMLKTPANGRVSLGVVTRRRYMGQRPELDRERLRRVVHVTARLSGVDLGTAIARVKKRLRGLAMPAGVTLEYGGLYVQQRRAFGELTMVLALGVIAMLLIVVWEFGRLTPAVAVLLSAISCTAGSLLALYLTGLTLNISSFMGIIMVVGITSKNGILLLDHAERNSLGGQAPDRAVVEAARIRLRPIVMTTLATAAGMLPLALGMGAGTRVQQPLAVAVIGGLGFAMLLSIAIAAGVYLIGARGTDASKASPNPA